MSVPQLRGRCGERRLGFPTRLNDVFEDSCDRAPEAIALECDGRQLSYRELDEHANRLAHMLIELGLAPGERVGIQLERSVGMYAAMLAVTKAGGVFVPVDADLPEERVRYMSVDAQMSLLLTTSDHRSASSAGCRVVDLERHARQLETLSAGRPAVETEDDPSCYVIYTSGSTGRPKGVEIAHSSIVNFLFAARDVYRVSPDDRVYQGMSIAFDFSVEEIWVPWTAGATVVAGPTDERRLGSELVDFLRERQITVLCCVPTLLGTLDRDVPSLRTLLVGGEACPQELVARWRKPGRRMLNTYGPAETTVTAIWTELVPDRAVTIGRPLPTYTAHVLDEELQPVPAGEIGEICIGGPGVGRGYLGRPGLTADRFVADPYSDLPGARLYRSRDLGRVNDDGEIEFHGRSDLQVKLRGYRIELEEIESVLLEAPGVTQAVVGTYALAPGVEELVAYYTPNGNTVDPGQVHEHLRDRLPTYMVPAYLEQIDQIPMMPSGKADRKALPAPSGQRRLASGGAHVAPESELESALAERLAKVLGVERVSVEGHFFDDLGASSLLMARFNAELRKDPELPAVSITDVYRHPTVRRLAAAVGLSEPSRAPAWPEPEMPAATGTPRYFLCGVLQLLTFLGVVSFAAQVIDLGAGWMTAAHGILEIYLRAFAFGGGLLLGMAVLPVAAKWILIGRWKPQRIRVWSLAYFRFWIVKDLVLASSLARLLLGTSLYGLYLRALGAKIGPRTVILTSHLPICTDLVSIGSGSVIRKETYLNGYRARAGVIEIGPVTLGENVFVGEHSVLDIYSTMEDGAQLGHSSSLQAGQIVPAGKCWHGSPAEPARVDYRTVPPAPCGALRRAAYAVRRLLAALVIGAPLGAVAGTLLLTDPRWVGTTPRLEDPIISAILTSGLLVLALLVAGIVPRLLTRALKPGKVYPLYGVHYMLQRIVSRSSNIKFLNQLLGDSSAIVHYLRLLGYRLGVVEQTGSNFGTEQAQEVPALSEIGTGTMVSDALSVMNAEFSSSSFRVMPVKIGERSYLGNNIYYPAGARVGDNCLLANKVMIPTGGPPRHDVGLLGSPSFEIPRSVERDKQFQHLHTGPEHRRRLAAKTRHNVVTMLLHMLVRYLVVTGVVVIALSSFGDADSQNWAQTVARALLDVVFVLGFFVLVERVVIGLWPVRPRLCSMYDVEFWRHERFWKVKADSYIQLFNGTPFKNVIWRLLGVRIGRRVFDDGCSVHERTLVSLGSESTLGMGTTLQAHSLEEGIFKSDHIAIGSGCTVGTMAFVHYGTVIEDGSLLEADSFLMKGSRLTQGARWRGNPAVEVDLRA